MIKKSLSICISCLTVMCSGTLQADTAVQGTPKFGGEIGIGGLKVDGRDIDAWAFELTAGFSGSYKVDNFSVNYQLLADFTGDVNDLDPLVYTRGKAGSIYIRDAKIAVPTPYGTFVVAPRSTSGQFAHLYGAVSDFEYNELSARSGINAMFTQGSVTTNLLAYATPRFAGWQVIGGAFTFRKDNDEDIDAWSYRALYENGRFNLGVGQVFISDEQTASGEKETRNAFTSSYSWDQLKIMTTVEHNDVPDGHVNDFITYSAGMRYAYNHNWSAAFTYANKKHEIGALENTALIAQVRRNLNKSVYVFAETGQYDNTPSNYAVGLNVKF